MTVKIEKDKLTEIHTNREEEEGNVRLFLKYEIGVTIGTRSGLRDMKEPWDMLYKFIAGMSPIAGGVKRNATGYLSKDTPDVEMWFLSRVPTLPSELYEWIKETGYSYDVKINSWSWGPQGVNSLSDEQVEELEGAFNSNLVMKEFLSVEPKEEA